MLKIRPTNKWIFEQIDSKISKMYCVVFFKLYELFSNVNESSFSFSLEVVYMTFGDVLLCSIFMYKYIS